MRIDGVPIPGPAVDELAQLVRAIGAHELADRLERAVADGVALLALTIDERAIILASLEDPPEGLAELRALRRTTGAPGPVRRVCAARCEGVWPVAVEETRLHCSTVPVSVVVSTTRLRR